MISILEKCKIPANPIYQGASIKYDELASYFPEFSEWSEPYYNLITEIKYFGDRTDITYNFLGIQHIVTIVKSHQEGLLLGYKAINDEDEDYWMGEYCKETWHAIMNHFYWHHYKDDIIKH